MKKLFLVILLIPFCFACEKEDGVEEPLVQLHFLNLVDDDGNNLFESNQIPTSEFYYVYNNSKSNWEKLMNVKEREISDYFYSIEIPDTVAKVMENNKYLLLEYFQGHLDRERKMSINGVEYTFRLSPLQDGFSQNGEPLQYSTGKLDKNYLIYLHHIVLEEY